MIAGTKKQRTKRPGIGATSGADAGSGVGSGRDVGSGAGATDGIGAGSGADSAAGSAADSGIGAGVDASSGAGVTDGSGAGVDASPGAGVTAGSGAGNATGKGAALPPLRSALDFAVFILIIAGFFLACLIAPKPDVLVSERRRPAELPAATTQNLTSARFQNSFEGWTADNFPLREAWRTARSLMVFDVLLMTDKEGLYWGEAGAGKIEPVDVGSVEGMADKLEGVVADLGSTTKGLSFYYAVIPDKSLYDGRDLPGFDPDVIARVLEGRLTEAKAIDLCAALGAKDFYRSDLHWDQAQLGEAMALEEGDDGTVKGLSPGVVDALGKAMGFSTSLDMQAREFEVRDAGPFTGVYGGQLALPLEPDRLSYLVNETIEGLRVSYLDPANGTFTPGPLYDLDAAQGRDPYDLFLRGAQPLIRIENPHASNPAELYLFRDSFGSSLAPLLAQGYSRITLIDLRYIDYRMVRDLIDFAPGSDVLFCYGSQIFNNSSVLLTP